MSAGTGRPVVGVDDPVPATTTPVVEPPPEQLAALGVHPPPGSEEDPLDAITGEIAKATPPLSEGLDEITGELAGSRPAGDFALPRDDDAAQRAMTAFLGAHTDLAPEQAAKVLAFATEQDVDPRVFGGDVSHLQVQVDQDKLSRVLIGRPGLAKYLSDTTRAALAKGDSEELAKIEDAINSPGSLWYGSTSIAKRGLDFLRDKVLLPIGGVETDEVLGQLSHALKFLAMKSDSNPYWPHDWIHGHIEELDSEIEQNMKLEQASVGDSQLGAFYLGTLRTGAMVGRYDLAGALGGWLGVAAGAVGGAVGGAETGPGEVVTTPAGAAIGATVGSLAAMGLYGYYEGSGDAYWRFSQMKDAQGRQMDPMLARAAAEAVGVLNGAFMAGLGHFGAKLPFVSKFLGRFSQAAAERSLAELTTSKLALDAVKKLGKNEALGVGTMMALSFLNSATEESTKEASNVTGGTHFEVDPLRPAKEAVNSIAPAARDFLVLSAWAPAAEAFRDVGRLRSARVDAQKLEEMKTAAASTKLASIAPTELQRAIQEAVAAGNEPQAIRTPVEDFIRYAQAQGLDPLEFSKATNEDDGKAFQDAATSGGDVVTPIPNALAKWVPSGHWDGLKDDIKLGQDDFTPRQAKREAARIAQKVQALLKQYEPGRDSSADAVYQDVFSRWMATGKVPENVADRSARIEAQIWGNWARSMGKDPLELYREKADRRIYGPNGETLDDSAQRAVDETKAKEPIPLTPEAESLLATEPGKEPIDEPGLKSVLRTAFDAMGLDERRRALFTDPVTGLLNARGFELLPAPADRPYLARFSFEGGKALNDFHGHESYDGALRLMAKTLEREGIPDGVKRAGDVEAYVRDQAHAAELAKAMTRTFGDKLRVTFGTAKPADVADTAESPAEGIAKTLKAVQADHTNQKDALVAKGELGHRKGVPAFVSKNLPRIDFDGKAEQDPALVKARAEYDAKLEAAKKSEKPEEALAALGPRPDANTPELIQKYGLPLDSKEAKAALKKAATGKSMRQLVDRLNKQAKAKGPDLTEAHRQAFLEHEQAGSTFDAIHYTKEGALTDEGYRLAVKTLHPKYFISADARGLRAMNDAFGEAGADRILAEFTRMLVEHGGSAFGLAHPHGDEYFALAQSPEVANAFFKSVKRHTDNVVFYKELADGRVVIQEGVHFAHGLGKTFDEADRVALPAEKRKQDAAGGVPAPVTYDADAGEKRLDELRDGRHRLVDVGQEAVSHGAATGEGAQDLLDRGGLPGDRTGHLEGHGEGPSGVGGEEAAQEGQAPGVALPPPTADDLAQAWKYIETLRSPEKRQQAIAWLTYVRDFHAGLNPEEPALGPKKDLGKGHSYTAPIDRNLELKLARFHIVDPTGFPFDYDGRDMRDPSWKPKGVRKMKGGRGEMPQALREHLIRTTWGYDLPYNFFKQGGEGPSLRLESQGGEKGFITFKPGDPGGKPRRFNLYLLHNADASTAAHETFHFLSMVMGDLAQDPAAPQSLKDDYAALLKWMGYEGGHQERLAQQEEHRQLSNKENRTADEEKRLKHLRAKEERAAVGWEQYLLEGRAPSAELVGPFAAFGRWLGSIYGNIKRLTQAFSKQYGGEELNLTDEVRGIFDRLLATQEATADYREREAAAAQPFAAVRAQMSLEERAAYDGAMQREAEATDAELYRRLAEEDRAAQRDLVRNRKKAIRGQVEKEVLSDPGQRAIYFFEKGELPDSPGSTPDFLKDENGKPYKLSRPEVAKAFGEDVADQLPASVFAKKGEPTAPLDALAGLLKFDSGKALVDAIADAPPRRLLIDAEAGNRTRAEFGPGLLDHPDALAEATISAAHNDKALQRRLVELGALRKLAFPDSNPKQELLSAENAKRLAEVLVRRKTVQEITGGEQGAAGYYLRAEREARKRALAAAEKGNWEGAFREQETALLNFSLYREALRLRDRLSKDFDKLTRSGKDAWRAVLGKADPAYQDAHDAILQAIGIRQEAPASSGPAALLHFVATAGGNAQEVGFDIHTVLDLLSKPKAWKELTVDEARTVVDAITNIRHAAKVVGELLLLDKTMSREEFIDEVTERLKGLPEGPKLPRDKALETALQKAGRGAQWLDAILTDTETRIKLLTGDDRSHPLYKLFVDGYLKARNRKEDLARQFLGKLTEKWEQMPESVREHMGDVVDIGDRLPLPDDVKDLVSPDGKVTLSHLLMIALNTGNEGNLDRLLGGYGWSRNQVMDVLVKELPREAWTWVQEVWDSLEELYPEIERLEFEETGLRPGKVQAVPIHLPDGRVLRGGYFPARYDPRVPSAGVRQEEGAISRFFDPAFKRATTAKSHVKKRAVYYEDVVNLDWSVVPAHVAQVLHDLAFRRYVKETAAVLIDPRFQVLMQRYLGRESALQLDPWLKAVANSQADAVPANLATGQKIIAGIRNRTAIQALGYNLSVALGDLSNPAVAAAIGKVRATEMSNAVAKTTAHWNEIRPWTLEQSPELRHRADRIVKALAHDLQEMGGVKKGGWIEAVREHAFVFMEWSDKLTATPIWVGRYDQALADGLPHGEAVKVADEVVRELFPPEDIAEASPLARDRRGLGSLVMFYGYMNKLYNVQRRWVRDLHLAFTDEESTFSSKAGAVAKFAGKELALALTAGAMSEFLAGRGKEQDESWGGWLLRKVLTLPFYTVPFTGPLVDRVFFGRQSSQRLTPGVAFVERTAETLGEWGKPILEWLQGKDVPADQIAPSEKKIFDAMQLLGFGPNIPTRPLTVTGRYGVDVATDQLQPRGPGDVIGGAVYGQRKKQSKNLFTGAQDLVSGD